MKKVSITVVAAFAVMLVVSASAMAQSTRDGYRTLGGQVQEDVQGDQGDTGPSGSQAGDDQGNSAPVAASSNGDGGGDGGASLPFTGLDVVLLAGAGALLAAAGLGMRRLTRAPDAV